MCRSMDHVWSSVFVPPHTTHQEWNLLSHPNSKIFIRCTHMPGRTLLHLMATSRSIDLRTMCFISSSFGEFVILGLLPKVSLLEIDGIGIGFGSVHLSVLLVVLVNEDFFTRFLIGEMVLIFLVGSISHTFNLMRSPPGFRLWAVENFFYMCLESTVSDCLSHNLTSMLAGKANSIVFVSFCFAFPSIKMAICDRCFFPVGVHHQHIWESSFPKPNEVAL